jgi:hypothetical protein
MGIGLRAHFGGVTELRALNTMRFKFSDQCDIRDFL